MMLNRAPLMTATSTYRRLAIALTGAIAVAAGVAIAVPAGFGWDFANFYDAGHKVLSWQIADLYDPSTLVGGGAPQGAMAFWGTPLSALLYAPMALLEPKAALVAFKIQGTIACFLALWLLYRWNREFADQTESGQWRFAATFALLVLVFQPFWSVYRVGGQTTPVLFLLATLAMLAHLRNRPWLASGCLVLAVAIKPAFAVALAALMILGGWPTIVASTVLGAGLALTSIAVMGWPIHLKFLDVMRTGLGASYPWQYNSSLYVIADNLEDAAAGASLQMIDAVVIGLKLIVLVLFGWLAWRSRDERLQPVARRHVGFLLALTFFLCITQTVWEHYLAVLFPLLVYVVASARHFSRGATMVIVSVFALCLVQNITFTRLLSDRLGELTPVALVVLGLIKSAPLFLTVVFLIRYREEFLKSHLTETWRQRAVQA